MPEFDRHVLEALHEPLESKEVCVARARVKINFPADFQLISAMNPCPCGWSGHSVKKCSCRLDQIERYQGRLSGPLLDRIDIGISIAESEQDWLSLAAGETSEIVRNRVVLARQVQINRQACTNGQLPAGQIERVCHMDRPAAMMLSKVVNRDRLSARSIQKVRRVSRTCADLAGHGMIRDEHIAEALQYRLRMVAS